MLGSVHARNRNLGGKAVRGTNCSNSLDSVLPDLHVKQAAVAERCPAQFSLVNPFRLKQARNRRPDEGAAFSYRQVSFILRCTNHEPCSSFASCAADFERTARIRGSGFVLGADQSFRMGILIANKVLIVLYRRMMSAVQTTWVFAVQHADPGPGAFVSLWHRVFNTRVQGMCLLVRESQSWIFL